MDVKAYFIDIDGTLVSGHSDHTLNLDDIHAIKNAIKEKRYIVLSTGRSIHDIKHIWEQIDLKTEYTRYIIANNGAAIWDMIENKLIFSETMGEEEYKDIFNYAKENKYIIKNSGERKFYGANNIFTKAMKLKEGSSSVENDYSLAEYNEENSKKLGMITSLNKKKVKSIAEDIMSKFKKLTVVISGPGLYIEINKKGVSKGQALKFICERANIDINKTVHIGDSMNDFAGFKAASVGIAMGNGMKQLKNEATFITDTQKKSGVSKAIKSLSDRKKTA